MVREKTKQAMATMRLRRMLCIETCVGECLLDGIEGVVTRLKGVRTESTRLESWLQSRQQDASTGSRRVDPL
jgi:hypothetical protein